MPPRKRANATQQSSRLPIEPEEYNVEGILLRSGLRVRRFGFNSRQLLERALKVEEDRLLAEEDDCEGHELTSAPPSRSPSPVRASHDDHPSTVKRPRIHSTHEHSSSTAISPDRRRRNEAAYKRKQRKRVAGAISPYEGRSFQTKPENIKKLQEITSSSVDFDVKELRAAGPGSFVGYRIKTTQQGKTPSPKQLVARGFKEVEWDGRTPEVIGDKEDTGFVIMAGRPSSSDWDNDMVEASDALKKARTLGIANGGFKDGDLQHRRGAFLAFASGVSFGGGQKKPGNLVQSAKRAPIVKDLRQNPAIRRIAGFQSRCLATFAPKIFNYAKETLKRLFNANKNLRPNFSNSVYPTITYNCGPDTECVEHVDHGNAAHMLCAVTALGDYDPKKGGHLILYPLKRFIQFPPGSTILVPSAMLAHGNTPIAQGETRMSLTQYCPGGLLRWVEYGFRSCKTLLQEYEGAAKKAQIDGPPGSRCTWALGLFSKLGELVPKDMAFVQDSSS